MGRPWRLQEVDPPRQAGVEANEVGIVAETGHRHVAIKGGDTRRLLGIPLVVDALAPPVAVRDGRALIRRRLPAGRPSTRVAHAPLFKSPFRPCLPAVAPGAPSTVLPTVPPIAPPTARLAVPP